MKVFNFVLKKEMPNLFQNQDYNNWLTDLKANIKSIHA